MADDLKFNLRIATENAQRDLKNTAKAAGELGDELDDTRSKGKKLADAMKADADRIDAELKESKATADLLAEALGSEFVAEVEQGGRSVQGMVMELKSLGVTYDDIRGDADAFADAIRRTEGSTKALDGVKGGFRRVGEEADNTRSVVANFAGNAAQELPGVTGAFGPLNMAIGQFAEYGTEGNIQMKNFIAAGAGLGGLSVAMWALSRGAEQAAKRAKELAEAQEDITRSTDEQIIQTFGKMMFTAALDGKDLNDQIKDLTENNMVGAKTMRDALAATGEYDAAVQAFDTAIREAEAGTALHEERTRKYGETAKDTTGFVDALKAAQEEHTAAEEKAAPVVDAVREAVEQAKQAAEDHRLALEEEKRATDELYDANVRLVGGELAVESAQRNAKEAVEDFTKVVDEGATPGSDAYAEAQLRAKDALLDSASAAADYRIKQAEASGTQLDAQGKAFIFRDELQKLASTMDPESPLYQALMGYIAQLDAIPEEINTRLNLNVTGATVTVGGDAIGNRGRGNTAVYGAEGGIVNRPTWALIGEAGPEAVVPLDQVPGNRPLSSSGIGGGMGGGGNTYVFQSLVAPSEAQLQEFGRWVDRYERRKRGGL